MNIKNVEIFQMVFDGLDVSIEYLFELEGFGRCRIIIYRCENLDEQVWWAAPHGVTKYDESIDDVVDIPFTDDAVKEIINGIFKNMTDGRTFIYDEAGDY